MIQGLEMGAVWAAGKAYGVKDIAAKYERLMVFCVPEGKVTRLQKIRVVVKYLEDHPEKLHEPPSVLITRALNEAFPCKSG